MTETPPNSIGIMGGTFDPPHKGHLCAAEAARLNFGLDKVLFIPAARPSFKDATMLTSAELRFRMVELACADNPYFEVSRSGYYDYIKRMDQPAFDQALAEKILPGHKKSREIRHLYKLGCRIRSAHHYGSNK